MKTKYMNLEILIFFPSLLMTENLKIHFYLFIFLISLFGDILPVKKRLVLG
jgi:hypothetical protein